MSKEALLILRSLIERDVVTFCRRALLTEKGFVSTFFTSRMCVSLKKMVAFFSVKGVGGGWDDRLNHPNECQKYYSGFAGFTVTLCHTSLI